LLSTPLAVIADPAEEPEEPAAGDYYEAGHGYVSLALQAIRVSQFNNGQRDVDIGSLKTGSAYVDFEYAVSSRWTVKLGLPYIRKSYNGPARHDPLTLDPPRPEVAYLDDGHYHGSLQDFLVGARYLLSGGPFIVEPFVYALVPSHGYPHFAQAAVGQNLSKVEMGVEATHFFPFSDWYCQGSVSYTVAEETLGVSINHFRLNGELGYFFAANFSVHAFFNGKHGRGDDGTQFPPSQRSDERWYQHDRTSRHDYLNVGVGADWYFNDRYQLFGSVLSSVWGKTVHLVDWAGTVGMTRYF
jgi:hypothetical protein